jgi:hypothetical protein
LKSITKNPDCFPVAAGILLCGQLFEYRFHLSIAVTEKAKIFLARLRNPQLCPYLLVISSHKVSTG